MGGLFSSLFGRRPAGDNPTFEHIKARQEAERAMREAEDAARSARELSEQIKREADQERESARIRQQQADQLAAQAAEEREWLKEQMAQAALAAQRAQEMADEAAKTAKEEATRLAEEAREERERSQKMQEEAEKAMAEMKMEADKAQRAADEQRRYAEESKALAEDMARTATAEAQKAKEAKEDAERRLKEGIRPIVTPTAEEIAAAKKRIQYRNDYFHFAIAGISGSGKSSLVNAFRGMRSKDSGAAAVGVTETTLRMTRYPDANPNHPLVWYDIPGAGTIKFSDWQYFNDQGLYVFDCIIVLFDNRFTMTDVAILMNARRFQIPTYIVRSKADQHIRNLMMESGYDSEEDEDDPDHRDRLYKAARKQFVEMTRKSVKTNLQDANLPDQKVYIVSHSTLLSIALNRVPKKTIDEMDLINDLSCEAYARRPATADP